MPNVAPNSTIMTTSSHDNEDTNEIQTSTPPPPPPPPQTTTATDEFSHDSQSLPSEELSKLDRTPSIIPVSRAKVVPTKISQVDNFINSRFDPNSPIYKASACCELAHYRTAAVLVAILQACLFVIIAVVIMIMFIMADNGNQGLALMGELTIFVMLSTIGQLIYGVVYEKPHWLWPQMILLMIMVGVGILLTVVAVVSMAAGSTWSETIFGLVFDLHWIEASLGPIWPFCLAVIFDFSAAIAIWFYILIRGCYDYLMDKEYFENNSYPSAIIEMNKS